MSVMDNYTHNSKFWRNSTAIAFAPVYPFSLGLEFDLTEHKNFDNHIYNIRLPIGIDTRNVSLRFVPFVLPDNGNGASAYGGRFMVSTGLKIDEVASTMSGGYFTAGIVSQKADVLKNGIVTTKDTFAQSAYEIGLSSNFFGVYAFNVSGNVYQYLSGLEGVKSVRGIFNQAELADLGTIDYMLGLPRASGGVKVTWRSEENHAESYISYRYIDMHEDNARHSVLLSSNIVVSEWAAVSLSYNHVFIMNETDIDVYGIGLNIKL